MAQPAAARALTSCIPPTTRPARSRAQRDYLDSRKGFSWLETGELQFHRVLIIAVGNMSLMLITLTCRQRFREATGLLESLRESPGHIFNLGQGITPTAKLECMQAWVDAVTGWRQRERDGNRSYSAWVSPYRSRTGLSCGVSYGVNYVLVAAIFGSIWGQKLRAIFR